jgi:hypothetical protein
MPGAAWRSVAKFFGHSGSSSGFFKTFLAPFSGLPERLDDNGDIPRFRAHLTLPCADVAN